MERREILLGNGAIALGIVESVCQVVTAYPGTPSSEIVPEVIRFVKTSGFNTYVEWSTNEKVALDTAFAASISGKRAACCMKQVGLNVAADSLMSCAYLGAVGGLVIISCDEPMPHSSATEQDTRSMARFAKVPVLDPSTPQEAREMVGVAFSLSEEFRVPVILRPAVRVCHARQSITYGPMVEGGRKADFRRNPDRWAATPRFRLTLHAELNEKVIEIGKRFDRLSDHNFHDLKPGKQYPLGIIAGGVPYAVLRDILREEDRTDIPVLKLGAPYPFPESLTSDFLSACEKVLVVEETDAFIEYLIRDRHKILGRLTGHIPREGELLPQVIHRKVSDVLLELGQQPLKEEESAEAIAVVKALELPVRKPSLCPGCPHRATFFAIRNALPKAIITSDIGCYTLGVNMGAVDTILDMGAAITMASGFYHSFAQDGVAQPIVSTIGDSTFFHSGTSGLLNAVYNGARFILVILDNLTTAMTGMQPTPALGIRANGNKGKAISLERTVTGCGVEFVEVVDPYDLEKMNEVLKKASAYVNDPGGGIAVIIARHPCLIAYREKAIPEKKKILITDDCVECNFCIEHFECPAIFQDQALGRTSINEQICSGCGVCLSVCPTGAIVEVA
jgi:indolepyruvate ferredoxin oxidoreductase alpha subunit